MHSVVIGILAIIAGAVFCLWGIVAMRIVITIWGAFVGFNLGAGLISAITGDGYLATALGWIIGVAVAILFALLAYLYYVVAVVLAMASIGFALGATLMTALGVSWNWVIILIGVVVGVLLAWAAIALRLPAVLLVVLSALAGSTAIVGGLMLLTDTLTTSEFTDGAVTRTIGDHWWWWALYALFAVVGIVTQLRMIGQDRDLQQQW